MESAVGSTDLADGLDELFIGDRDRRSPGCADRVEDKKIADRLGHTQS